MTARPHPSPAPSDARPDRGHHDRAGRLAALLAALCSVAAPGAWAQAQAADDADDEGGLIERFWNSEFWRDMYVGIQTNVSQDPYIGEDIDIFAFPRPDRLEDYVFNEDRFAFREGVALLRLAHPTPWEFSLVGHIDTRGYDPDDNDALLGLDDRDWTVSAGVGGAWRGDGVFVEAWGVTDTLGRSNGQRYAVSVGFPRKLFDDRLELVPHVDLFWDSADMVDYYYGVRPDETAPGRPAFRGDGAATLRLVTRANYRFSRCWALTGRLTADVLGQGITDSPIVDRDVVWSSNFTILRRLRCERDTREGD